MIVDNTTWHILAVTCFGSYDDMISGGERTATLTEIETEDTQTNIHLFFHTIDLRARLRPTSRG